MTDINRRNVLEVGFGAAIAAPFFHSMSASAMVSGDPVAQAFAAACETKSWTLGLIAPKTRELGTDALERIGGKLPEGFEGTFYRNGPALFERSGWRYRHWFDGDGMVHRYRIANGNISHRARYVQTPKLLKEDKAGHFLMPAFGSLPDPRFTISGPDDLNAANISVLPLGNDVLTLWEGGSAFTLDGTSLATKGPKTWRADLQSVPFSAHPKVAPDGTILNFGAMPSENKVILYRIDRDGALIDAKAITLPAVGMMHDFVITQRSALFIGNSWAFDALRMPYVDCFTIDPKRPMLAMAVPLDGGDLRIWELPPGFVFHFGNAFEDRDGTIRFDAMFEHDITWPKYGAEALMRGQEKEPGTRLGFVTLKADAKTGSRKILPDELGEFPKINPRRVGMRHRYLYHVGHRVGGFPVESRIVKYDWTTGRSDAFDYGPDMWTEEHLFVPGTSTVAEDGGYLVGTVLNLKKKRTELHILDARRPGDGPVASYALPYHVPVGFHGAWTGV